YSKLGILLIGILISFTNCELEEETIIQKETVFKTASKNKVLDYLNSYTTKNSSARSRIH
ncbi:MAG: hypothetical protein C0448_16185, partial [Sphingobacteriaceae bacterium]|nr:hypothetical protein [Sphingobacteriaceae bacterium]